MTTHVTELPARTRTSRRIASEIRAELARQGINQTELARRLHVSQAWTSRRLNAASDVELTFEEVERIAEALAVSDERLALWWLPRLDSNQQPSGYPSSQLSAVAEVIYLDERRAS